MQSGKINSLNSGNYASILGYEYINGDDWRLGFPVDEKENGYSGDIRGCFNCEVSYECNSGSQGQDPGTTCNKGDHSFCIGNTGYGMLRIYIQ